MQLSLQGDFYLNDTYKRVDEAFLKCKLIVLPKCVLKIVCYDYDGYEFLPFTVGMGAPFPESFSKGVVVNLQLGDL